VPVTSAQMASFRAQIVASVAYSAYNTAHAAFVAASRSARPALGHAAYSDAQEGLSPAYRLKTAIRDAIASLAPATVTAAEREETYRTLVEQYVATPTRPRTAIEDQVELQKLLIEDAAS
jgi:hypothetical protein